MSLVIPLVVVLLLVAAVVTFVVLNATKKGGPVADDEGAPDVGGDESPLGDTTQHADAQANEGTSVRREDDDPPDDDPSAAGHVARPGEAEGREQLDFDGRRAAARERS